MNNKYVSSIKIFRPEIIKKAKKHNLDPALIAAIVIVESSGNPWAIRVEPAFWRRYGNNYHKIIEPSHPARVWLKYPDVFACSYGLMQIMFGVAVEHGCRVSFPTELLKPDINLEFGCRILSKKIQRKQDLTKGVLSYNGGGNPHYPDKVFRFMHQIDKENIF